MESAISIIALLLLAALVAAMWEAIRLLHRVKAQLSALVRIQRRAHERSGVASVEPEVTERRDRRVADRRRADRDARAQAFVN